MDFLVLKNDHNEYEILVEWIACGQHFQLTTGRGIIKTIIIRDHFYMKQPNLSLKGIYARLPNAQDNKLLFQTVPLYTTESPFTTSF